MKIDPRVSNEFGVEFPPPTPWWRWQPMTVNRVVELVFGNAVPFTTATAVLGLGAFAQALWPLAVFVFAAISALAGLIVLAVFGLVLVANSIDVAERE
jgi:hypothetical protein